DLVQHVKPREGPEMGTRAVPPEDANLVQLEAVPVLAGYSRREARTADQWGEPDPPQVAAPRGLDRWCVPELPNRATCWPLERSARWTLRIRERSRGSSAGNARACGGGSLGRSVSQPSSASAW